MFNLGSFTTFPGDAGPFGVDVSWGDGSPDTTFFVASAGALPMKAHTYTEEGPYVPTVTVTDFLSLSGSATANVNVTDPAAVGTGGFSLTAAEGALSANQTVATFTDPAGAESTSNYSATINWNDGTRSAISAKSSPPRLASNSPTTSPNCLRTAATAGSRTLSSLRSGGTPRR